MTTKVLIVALTAIGLSISARAQNVNIPDANFKSYLLGRAAINTNGDDEISVAEAAAYTGSIIVKGLSISDLTGIEAFSAITKLNCSSNSLASLDLSKNTAITYLDCGHNSLMNLDLSKNTALTYLDCNTNSLSNLDVSKNTALTDLYCFSNDLSSLDVSNNTALAWLGCYANSLTNLDVSKNTALTWLSCYYSSLTKLDVSKNAMLIYLFCFGNSLTNLDVSKNTALTDLECGNNILTSLDVSNNSALRTFYCEANSLRSLNMQNGNNSNFFNFRAANNPNLTCILVSDAAYMYSHFLGAADASASFNETSCPQYTTSASVNPANAGTIIGEGNYYPGENVTLTAIPETGYTFTAWTENGKEVSTSSTYTFITHTDMVLVANFTSATGIADVNVAQALVLYPNPSAGKFALELNSSYSGNLTIKIYAAGGSAIKEFQVSKPAGKLTYPVDLGNVAAGLCYVDITTANEKVTKMVVVSR